MQTTLRIALLLIVACALPLSTAAASFIIPASSIFSAAETRYTYIGSPQVAALDDGGNTLIAVFEASAVSSTMGSPDQFVGLTFSGDAGEHWLDIPLQVKLGDLNRPMWRPVIVAQSVNATTGIIFLYFSQYQISLVSNVAGGDIYQSSAYFSSSLGGLQNCSLLTSWTPAVRVWETFGFATANPLVTSAIPLEWANSQKLPPSSWVIAVSQFPEFGYSSYATLFITTEDTGLTWSLASSTFSTTNKTEAYTNAQLIGSEELVESSSSSSSGSSSAPSSSSSSTDVGPLVSLSAVVTNPALGQLATTASGNGGKSWSPLLVAQNSGDADDTIDFTKPLTAAAYYASSLPILAYFPTSSSTLLTIRQLGSSTAIAQLNVQASDVSGVGMSVQAVWRKPRSTVFYVVVANANQSVIQLGKVWFNEAKPEAETDSATAIAVTFCVIGGVYAAILAAYVLGVIKARRQRAADGQTLLGSGASPASRNSARRSVSERTILV